MGPNQAVSVEWDAPRLMSDAASEVGNGIYQLPVGSDHCETEQPLRITVDGVAVDSVLTGSFGCAPVDATRSVLTTDPLNGQTTSDRTITVRGTIQDQCALPAFGRMATFSSTLGLVVAPPPSADPEGKIQADYQSTSAGTGTASLTVEGAALGPVPVQRDPVFVDPHQVTERGAAVTQAPALQQKLYGRSPDASSPGVFAGAENCHDRL